VGPRKRSLGGADSSMVISIDPQAIIGPVPALRGVYLGDSPEPSRQEDVARLQQEVGVTCIRFGVEPLSLSVEEEPVYHEAGFTYIQAVLDWCEKYGVACILDLHNALGRLYGGAPRLWTEPYFQDRFLALWETIARRFRNHPSVAAYELLNEPEPPNNDCAVWNDLHRRTAEAVRRINPYRTIVLDSVKYANPHYFSGLELSGDPNTVYSFHNYQPGPYHCQERRELKDQSTYYYPGFIPRKPPEDPQDLDLAHSGTADGRFWNRAQLIEEWQEPLAFRKRYNVPLFCGEFGCVSDVPEMTDLMYLMDEISLLHEQGIHWTLYSAMYRTSDPHCQSHFDCCLYIDYSPESRLYRFGRKLDLIRFFCRTDGDVLELHQPDGEWVGVYGVRRLDGGLSILISSKDRRAEKQVTLSVRGLPGRWTGTLQAMEKGDDGFVSRPRLECIAGRADLHLPPLSLVLVTIPAPADRLWRGRECSL
jgi:endoglucanase